MATQEGTEIENGTCGDCKFWEMPETLGALNVWGEHYGVCHRYPPQSNSRLPTYTVIYWWCGEHRLAPPPNPDA